jgi:hypothetical protein
MFLLPTTPHQFLPVFEKLKCSVDVRSSDDRQVIYLLGFLLDYVMRRSKSRALIKSSVLNHLHPSLVASPVETSGNEGTMSEVKLDSKVFHRRAKSLLSFWKVSSISLLPLLLRKNLATIYLHAHYDCEFTLTWLF